MKPNEKWIEDWRIGLDQTREEAVAGELFRVFAEFWDGQALSDKSKTTQNRYAAALHALGGYLVEKAVSDDDLHKTTEELISEHVGPDDGPLIHYDNEAWQNEVDMVCRKLYRYRRR